MTVDLAKGIVQGAAGTDSLVGFENALGSSYRDVIYGDAESNRLNGGGGADEMYGSAGGLSAT